MALVKWIVQNIDKDFICKTVFAQDLRLLDFQKNLLPQFIESSEDSIVSIRRT